MEDDINLDFNQIEEEADRKLKAKNRFQDLSEKVRQEAQAKEAAEAKAKAESEARASAEQERDFFKNFAQVSSKYQGSAEYQDKVFEKVKSGYDLEDAIIATMARENKAPVNAGVQSTMQPEGGSALTQVSESQGLNDMSAADKLAQLQELEKSGELSKLLWPNSRT